ncbi:hypothetical protein I7X12_05670 [Halosimplex litoreum]|uniref:Uncharacterized protein n=1 Tax=Halosimplex litoreum TaxID=1198301 RepID=A0A7T3G0K2_9EURY|nr:hypothetical protein [Halosimplex litoreum]QPV64113.1 hypothetical protein I7X12_05670 [Halosimplex litoreum]
MEANILGQDDQGCGVEVFDENNNRHSISINWGGTIHKHSTENYPLQPENRTPDEQRIMTQVEERAKYAAQQEFPDAEILHPMWDPAHVEAGLRSLASYDVEAFHEEFREFYEAIQDPKEYVQDPEMDEPTAVVNKPLRFSDDQLVDVADLVVEYQLETGQDRVVGSYPSWPTEETLVLHLPKVELAEDFVYEDQMEDVVVSHVMAQIRDIYLNMGEDPPEEYRVEGIGKLHIVGDEGWMERQSTTG